MSDETQDNVNLGSGILFYCLCDANGGEVMEPIELIKHLSDKAQVSGHIPTSVNGHSMLALIKCVNRISEEMNESNYSVWKGEVKYNGKTYRKKIKLPRDATMRGVKKHFHEHFCIDASDLRERCSNYWRYKIRNIEAHLIIRKISVTNK